jgi:hypothetical protein
MTQHFAFLSGAGACLYLAGIMTMGGLTAKIIQSRLVVQFVLLTASFLIMSAVLMWLASHPQ